MSVIEAARELASHSSVYLKLKSRFISTSGEEGLYKIKLNIKCSIYSFTFVLVRRFLFSLPQPTRWF